MSSLLLVPAVLFFAAITSMFLTSFGLFAALLAVITPEKKTGAYGLQVWLAFDRMWNAILNGDSRETVSSRLGKSLYYGHGTVLGYKWIDKAVSNLLDNLDPDHCRKSIEPEHGRRVGTV